jgi:predicted XRE-type DNA-binding protein
MTEIRNDGSSFDDFLEEQGLRAEADEVAIKRVLAWQLKQEMRAQRLSKAGLARLMETSRPQVDRLLDPDNTGVTLHTLHRAAAVLGKQLTIGLDDADPTVTAGSS